MGAVGFACAPTRSRKPVFVGCRADPHGGNEPLRVIGIKQKRRELLAAESRADIAGTQRSLDYGADLFECFATNEVAIVVVYFLKMIDVHHQDAEGLRLSLGAGGFSSQLGKK